MTPTAHLTEEQFTGYRERSLTPPELLDAGDHLSSCAACRDRLYTEIRAFSGLRSLQADLSLHLDYAAIAACSEGLGDPRQLAHLRRCALCQAEVQDLSRFRTGLHDTPRKPVAVPPKPLSSRRLPIAVAAGILLLAGVASIFALRRPPAPAPAAVSAAAEATMDPSLPPPEREILRQAISTGSLERAAVLRNLISSPGAPVSPAQRPAFVLLAPVGTTVLSDRPLFRWTMSADALSYVVSIFDEQRQKVAESPVLTATEWRLAEPLPRGKVLSWRVTARAATAASREPAPPAARFQIVQPEVIEHIEQIRRDFPGNPLLLAALYAHHGALDDAEDALRAIDTYASQSYRESIARYRRGE